MRNFYLFLLIAFSTHTFGQELSYSGLVTVGTSYEAVNVSYVLGEGDNAYPINGSLIYLNTNIPVLENYYVGIISYNRFGTMCIGVNTYTATQLLEQSVVTVGGCGPNMTLSNFKPNNLQILTTNGEVCAGEQLNLIASPAGYPDAAYHWQYSLDNQETWFNVPLTINDRKINKTASSNFSIQEILGDNHLTYINKTIYFRLGYIDSFISAEPLAIKYSACAPVITNLNAIQPNCSGDPMTVIVTFDRPLDLAKNEKLTNFQIIKKNGQLTGNQISEIFAFDASNATQYTYNNVTGLINGEIYTVKYQAFLGVKERGVPETDKDFQYQDPKPVQFEIVSAENPLCHNGTVEIVIRVEGGTGAYKFYDGTIEIIPTPINGTNGIYHLKNLAPKEYKIKVVDGNGCIDENKYE